MAINFPSNPTNGQVFGDFTYSTTNGWVPTSSFVVSQTNGTVTTASTTATVVRNITLSTANPSGGIDGDVWLKYTP